MTAVNSPAMSKVAGYQVYASKTLDIVTKVTGYKKMVQPGDRLNQLFMVYDWILSYRI
ncbi:hypothetical protein GCM10009096_33640 [Parasphingorhabdus litoris]|uniref:Uncharacterized protein n=1 Tax=Parasphingorhabdus litoris TaxID=394733 RepID=A0ABN1B0R1_9SPHN